MLTDTGSNMRELFEPDREVVTYSSFDECLEKSSYLLNHEPVMREIALAGQRRTLRDHSSAVRFRQINSLIEEAMRA